MSQPKKNKNKIKIHTLTTNSMNKLMLSLQNNLTIKLRLIKKNPKNYSNESS